MSYNTDTSNQRPPRTGRKKINPARAPMEDLLAYLDTHPQSGLTPKEAQNRLLRRRKAGSRRAGSRVAGLFAMDKSPLKTSLIPILKEPVMWLLLVVAVVACVFRRNDIGVGSLCLLLFHGLTCLWMGSATARLERQMQVYDIPLARVIRNHRPMRVVADCVVPGDIILLREGDIVPADARLLSSYHLVVAEDTLEGDPALRQTLRLEKDARVMPESMPRKNSPPHMVWAGSLVTAGEGRAVVTATGERTHMGGLLGKIPPSHQNTTHATLQSWRKKLSLVNLVVAVVAVPLTAVGILTLGRQYDLLDLFATALALSVLTLTEHIFVLGNYLSTSLRHTSANHPDNHLSCEIRDTQTLEKLRQMDCLVLMGTAALHDGVFMPESVLTCGQTYTCAQSAVDEALTYWAEKMFLYAEGMRSKDEALAAAVEKITTWAGSDVEGLMLRLTDLQVKGDGVRIFVGRNQSMTLYLTPYFGEDGELDSYPWMRWVAEDGQQIIVPMDAEEAASIQEWQKAATKQSKRVFALVNEVGGELCFEGLVAFVAETCPKTKGVLSAFQSAGIAVTTFLPQDDVWNHTYYLREAGLLKPRQNPHNLRGESAAEMLALTAEGVGVFAGSTTTDVVSYIQLLKESGHTVGVLSVDGRDVALLSEADIAITCVSAQLKDALLHSSPMSVSGVSEADGQPDSDTTTDMSRYMADVVVRRASRHGGGVCGVRQALLTAEQMQKSGQALTRYLILSQVLRAVMILIPLLAGLGLMSAPVLLFSGFVTDLLVYWNFAKADIPTELTSRRLEKDDAMRAQKEGRVPSLWEKLSTPLAEVVIVGASCLIPWVGALVAKLLHVKFGADLGYFGMLCLLGAQFAVYLTCRRPRRHRLGFFLTVGLVCLYAGALSVALAAGLSVMWCLIFPLVQPLCLFVALKIAGKCQKRR